MVEQEGIAAAQPLQDCCPVDACRPFAGQRVIGGVGPIAVVVYEAMFLWVLMDIDNQVGKVFVGCDRDAAERALK